MPNQLTVVMCAGSQLRQQVAELQMQYTQIGDQLENEQNRIMQVTALADGSTRICESPQSLRHAYMPA